MTQTTHHGSCHCGAVQFSFNAPDVVTITDCNCSLCAMTAYQHVFVEDAELTFQQGRDAMTSYRFGTRTAEHLFCATCGIKPLYRPRSHPGAWSVNARCVPSLTVGEVIEFDGQNWEQSIDGLHDALDA